MAYTNPLLEQPLAVLATQGVGGVHTSLISIAVSPLGDRIWFATLPDTQKTDNMKKYPQVSLLLDDRSSHETLPHISALTVQGHAVFLAGAEAEAAATILLARHPDVAVLLADPSCSLVEIVITQEFRITGLRHTS